MSRPFNHLFFAVFFTLFAILIAIACCGCQSTIKGGDARKTGGVFEVSVPTTGGLVVIRDGRTSEAVKQPDVRTNQALPQTATAKPGEIGGVTFKALPSVSHANLIAGGVLIALGAAFLFVPLIKQPGTGYILIAAGVTTMVYPWALLVGLAVALVWFAVKKGGSLKRVAEGVEHAMKEELSPDQQKSFKGYMAEKQDSADKAVIAALKPKP